MASFAYTNAVTALTSPTGLGLKTNYANIEDEPTQAKFANTTASLGQGEVVTVRSRKIDTVNTNQDILYPAPTARGVQYSIRLDEILRDSSAANNGVIFDYPIVMELTVRHPLYAGIDNSTIAGLLARLVNAAYDETAKAWRFSDLARQAIVPDED